MATILVVDDKPVNRQFLTTLLGYSGHRLLEAGDGAEALVHVRAAHPALVIADIVMPTMDGYEFVRQLRSDPAIAQTPVLFYTASYHEREARALAEACGVSHVLFKPVDPKIVLETVSAALSLSPAPPPAPRLAEFDREHLRVVTDKLSEKVNDLEAANLRLAALLEVGQKLASESDPLRMFEDLCPPARELIASRYAAVALLEEEGRVPRRFFICGTDAETARQLSCPPIGQGLLARLLAGGRPLRLRDIGADVLAADLPPAYLGARSFLGMPIGSPSRLYGALYLLEKLGAEEFSEEDERVVATLAAQAAVAYENLRRYEKIQQQTAELEREVTEREGAEQLLAVQYKTACALAEAATLAEAAPRILEAICEALEWQHGAMWSSDRTTDALHCVETWHTPSVQFPEFTLISRKTTFSRGIGLPGRVWASGQPAWIPDVVQDTNFPRAAVAAKEGLHAALCFPIVLGSEILGVVEFFSREIREPDEKLLAMLTNIGSQIGQYTTRRRVELALRQKEEQLRLLLDSTGEGIYGIDLNGNCTFCNPACLRLLGYNDSRDLLGKNMHLLIHHTRPDGTPYAPQDCRIYQAFRLGEGTHVDDEVLWRADGTSFAAECFSYPVRRGGETIGAVVTLTDITERKRAEEKFYKAFNASPEPVTIGTLSEGRYLDVNRSFLRITGYRREEVVGRTANQLKFWEKPRDRAKVLQMLEQQGSVRDMEITFQTKSGERRVGLLSAEIIEVDRERCLLAVTKDITERKALEEQLRQAQKMEAIGRLSGGIAHDFNNLLGVIIGYGELLEERLGQSDPLRKNAEEIRKAGHRAASLTRQLLAFSRQQVLEPRVLDLNAVVTDTEKMLRRLIGEDIELTTALDSALGRVKADQGQIEQVILNLVVNARDAMPEGGKLMLETANVELDEDYARQHPPVQSGLYVLLAVSDTGIGMDAQTQAHIFEPFFTTKEQGKGTGLGLATVYGVVKQSGGYIWVYSEPGRGTTFKIYLPRVDEAVEGTKLSIWPARSLQGSETILLVEDEESLRTLTRSLLTQSGYTVLEANSGAQALEIAQRHQGPIHLLLTDVVMPQMGGRALTESLALLRPDMKVLYMSGYTEHAIATRGVLDPGILLLQKPFTREILTRKVREALGADKLQNPGVPAGLTLGADKDKT